MKKENEKTHESTRDHFEKDKNHLDYFNRPSNHFCNVIKTSISKSGFERRFLTIEHLIKNRNLIQVQ